MGLPTTLLNCYTLCCVFKVIWIEFSLACFSKVNWGSPGLLWSCSISCALCWGGLQSLADHASSLGISGDISLRVGPPVWRICPEVFMTPQTKRSGDWIYRLLWEMSDQPLGQSGDRDYQIGCCWTAPASSLPCPLSTITEHPERQLHQYKRRNCALESSCSRTQS